jgi:hypothetical protein
MIRDDVLERHFRDSPDVLQFIDENRIVEPYHEGIDHDMRVIPGDRRDIMALPAASIDGRIDEPWFIDLRLDAEDYGAIYIGKTMFHYMAQLVGYCEVEEHRRAIARIEELNAECIRLRRLIGRLNVVRSDLSSLDDEQDNLTPAENGRRSAGRAMVENRQPTGPAA